MILKFLYFSTGKYHNDSSLLVDRSPSNNKYIYIYIYVIIMIYQLESFQNQISCLPGKRLNCQFRNIKNQIGIGCFDQCIF